jgi:hypothetical protein
MDKRIEQIYKGMMLNNAIGICLDGSNWHGWLFAKHPDGQWVSLCKIAHIDALQTKNSGMWEGIINRDVEITDNRQVIDRLTKEVEGLKEENALWKSSREVPCLIAACKKLGTENWQLRGALGYSVPGDIPDNSNIKNGTAEALQKELEGEREKVISLIASVKRREALMVNISERAELAAVKGERDELMEYYKGSITKKYWKVVYDRIKAENAALRERLKPVEEAYKKYEKSYFVDGEHTLCFTAQLWQAIKAAQEGKQ